MTQIKIITDSSSNLLPKKEGQIKVVPLTISLNGHNYLDDKRLNLPAFLRAMKVNQAAGKTACPSIEQWLQALTGTPLAIIVTLTSGLSGTYESALQAVKIYLTNHPQARVITVDSRSAGPEIAVIIGGISKLLAEKPRFVDLDQMIAQYRMKTHLLFILQNLHNLALNGRVAPAVAKVASLLHINLVGTADQDGKLKPLCKARGNKRALTALWRQMQAMNYHGGPVMIDHCLAPKQAQLLKAKILAAYPAAKIRIRPTRGLCSFYVEQGGIMVGFHE